MTDEHWMIVLYLFGLVQGAVFCWLLIGQRAYWAGVKRGSDEILGRIERRMKRPGAIREANAKMMALTPKGK